MIGILLAIAFRGVFILLGAALIASFSWIFYVFGAFLVFVGLQQFFSGRQDDVQRKYPADKLFDATHGYDG